MANNNSGKLKHVLVVETATLEAYSPHGGGPRFNVAPRNRRRHAADLLRQFRGIRTDIEGIQEERQRLGFDPEAGIVLQFESLKDFPLKFESLDLRAQGIELLSVRERDGKTAAVCYVPNGKLNTFIERIEAYRDEHTRGGKPKNNPLVANIESVQLAAVDALWSDDLTRMPAANVQSWWEIWLRSDDPAVMADLPQAAERAGITLTDEILRFPERTVVTANCTKRQLGRALRLVSTVAELREAKQTAADFVHTQPQKQYEIAQAFLAGISVNEHMNTAACILDTGVTQAHPLLEIALSDHDCHSYKAEWGAHDTEGHGTEMAGLTLYGDLASAIKGGPLELEHCLESVKILNPNDPNPPHLYGAVTIRASEIVEAVNPERKRVIGMAITAHGIENGEPSTWSAAVDALTSGYSDDRRRLMAISAGNSEQGGWHIHPGTCLQTSVQDPGQAWNALTIGACTHLDQLPAAQYPGWNATAVAGDVSPYSSTSAMWNPSWPIKPDVVFEGGNCAIDPNTGHASQADELSLLTTHGVPADRPFSLLWATSAATANAAHFAATLQARYPDFWPETIRGLVVHSADWTDAMKQHFHPLDTREKISQLMRYCGYGAPNLEQASWSASNQLTLIAQDRLQPYGKKERGGYKTKDIAIHTLPWPKAVLQDLHDAEVELRVTLSYFIEPNPGRRGWTGRYRYASHALRFDVKTPTETEQEFRQRVRSTTREDDDEGQVYASDAGEWEIGPQLRHRGSIHSDRWRGTASQLAERNMVAVFPVVGWWRERHHLQRWDRAARYSLIVTLKTPTEEVDIYTPVATQVGIQIGIDTTAEDGE